MHSRVKGARSKYPFYPGYPLIMGVTPRVSVDKGNPGKRYKKIEKKHLDPCSKQTEELLTG